MSLTSSASHHALKFACVRRTGASVRNDSPGHTDVQITGFKTRLVKLTFCARPAGPAYQQMIELDLLQRLRCQRHRRPGRGIDSVHSTEPNPILPTALLHGVASNALASLPIVTSKNLFNATGATRFALTVPLPRASTHAGWSALPTRFNPVSPTSNFFE